MLLLPALGAYRVAPRLDNHALERLNSLAHLAVQLLLHRVDMVRDVLAETGHE